MKAATPAKLDSEAEAGESKAQRALILAFFSPIVHITRSASASTALGARLSPKTGLNDGVVVDSVDEGIQDGECRLMHHTDNGRLLKILFTTDIDMKRILYSILFVVLLAQTSAASTYTFTSTYMSNNFPGIGGEQTVTVKGAFDFTGTFLGPVTNFQFTSIDVPTGLNVDPAGYVSILSLFDPTAKKLSYAANGNTLTFNAPALTFISDGLIGIAIARGFPPQVFGSTVVDIPEVPLPSSILMLGPLAATVGFGSWIRRRRKV